MNEIRRALVLTAAARYFGLAVNFVMFAVVSRILAPAEIGVSVLAIAVIAIAISVREFTTIDFIIQLKELKLEDVRASFTVLMLVSVAISSALLVSADGLASSYGEPKLAPYLRIVSISLLIEVIGAPVSALLRRQMQFAKLAAINVAGTAVNAGVTVVLAVLGFSYMSFAWAGLASASVVTCLSLLIWTDRSIFKPSLRGWRGIVRFGSYNGGNLLLFRLYEFLPYLVLARIFQLDALALYNRSVTICQLPEKILLAGVSSVLLSAFAAEARSGRSLREAYLRSVELITAVQWPALLLLAILANPVVHVLLGDQWRGSVPLVRIMAIASMFSFSGELNYPVLVAVGAMRDILKRSLLAWPISAVITTFAAFFGLEAAALSWLVTLPFQAYVSLYFIRRHVEISWRDIAAALQKAAVVASSSAAGPLAVIALTGGDFDLSFGATAAAVILGAIGWGAGLWGTQHPLFGEMQRLAHEFLRSPRPRKASLV